MPNWIWQEGGFRVYVLWCRRRRVFYVGSTGLSIGLRFWNHQRGHRAGRVVKRLLKEGEVWAIHLKLTKAHCGPFASRKQAERAEAKLARRLASQHPAWTVVQH